MGMTAEQYWDGDNDWPKAFRKYDEIRQERNNEAAWMQGMYFLEAIGAAFAKNAKYPKQPYPLNTSISKERQAKAERENMLIMREQFAAKYQKINRQLAEKAKLARAAKQEEQTGKEADEDGGQRGNPGTGI